MLLTAEEINIATGKTATYWPVGRVICMPAEVIEQVLGDFGAACHYFVMVINCTIESQGIAALRTLTYTDGSTIIQRLQTLDDAAYRLSYALLGDTPFRTA